MEGDAERTTKTFSMARTGAFVRALAAAVLILGAGTAAAQDRDRAGSPAPGNSALSDGFQVVQVTTDDPVSLMAAWSRQTPGVSLKGTTRIVRGKALTSFVVFRGSGTDADGKCDVTARVTLVDPAGKSTEAPEAMPVCAGVPAPRGMFQMSRGNFAVGFDADDALGAWQFKVTVTDHVSGKVLHTAQTVTLEADAAPGGAQPPPPGRSGDQHI